jgi:hypothetical protein
MGCGCGNKAQKEFIYTTSRGTQETHPTLLAARAAQIRDKKANGGNGGAIREVEKVRR